MKSRLSIGLAALGCVFLASCYPYPEKPGEKKEEAVKKEPTLEELKKQKEEEARKKAEEDLKEKKKETEETVDDNTGGGTTEDPQPMAETKNGDYPFANKVPGKDGFVFSPYNNKVVDVRDIPSGTLVMDPTYPPSEKKYFRVP